MLTNIQNLFYAKRPFRFYFRGRMSSDVGYSFWHGELISGAEKEGEVVANLAIKESSTGLVYIIDPITLGAWIGKYDIDGKPVYEDDIVKIQGKPYVIAWENTNAYFFLFDPNEGKHIPWPLHINSVKIAGNIYDNPDELIWENNAQRGGNGGHPIVR